MKCLWSCLRPGCLAAPRPRSGVPLHLPTAATPPPSRLFSYQPALRLLVAPCTSLCVAHLARVCKSNYVEMNYGSHAEAVAEGRQNLSAKAAYPPPSLPPPHSLAKSAKQNKSQMPHIINICARALLWISYKCHSLCLPTRRMRNVKQLYNVYAAWHFNLYAQLRTVRC